MPASIAFIVFDYILTLPLEVTEIWRGKFSLTKALFLVNRYLFLIAEIALLLFTVWANTDKVLFLFHMTEAIFS